jgi:hypothetical protein
MRTGTCIVCRKKSHTTNIVNSVYNRARIHKLCIDRFRSEMRRRGVNRNNDRICRSCILRFIPDYNDGLSPRYKPRESPPEPPPPPPVVLDQAPEPPHVELTHLFLPRVPKLRASTHRLIRSPEPVDLEEDLVEMAEEDPAPDRGPLDRLNEAYSSMVEDLGEFHVHAVLAEALRSLSRSQQEKRAASAERVSL